MASTTALLRKIDQQAEQSRQDAWDDRANRTRRRPPKWACDFLVDTGAITPEQHDAAMRLTALIERGYAGDPLAGSQADPTPHLAWDTSFAADVGRTQRAWDRATSRESAAAAHLWVASVLRATNYKRSRTALLRTFTGLFGFDGSAIVGPRATWKTIRGVNNCPTAEAWVCACLDALIAYFVEMDGGYGPPGAQDFVNH